ncbi:MAG: META domain-containing protein [Chloroflexi bacterium]|nr:META domain-containing protein [Chloroflexota bacterium]
MLRKQTNKQSFGMMVITLLMLLVAAACTPVGNEPSNTGNGEQPVPSATPDSAEPSSEVITMIVGPETVACEGEAPQTCLQVKYSEDEEWQLFYDSIAGFEHAPTFQYELRVKKIAVANPPADGSSFQYELVEVVDQIQVDVMTSNELLGTKWDLIAYGDQTPVSGSELTLNFENDGLGGTAGCNSYFGSYTVDGTNLSISEVGSTMMACVEDALMTQESTFLGMLQAAESFTLSDEQLIIHTAQGDLVFQPAQNQSLEGVTWVLNGLAQNDAIVSTWVDSEITATFAEGQVTGSAGCNQYFATYEMSDTTLTIGAIGSTKMACEEEKNQRETEFLTAMASVAGYEIERDSLKLLDANGDTLLLFQAQKAN